MKSKKIVIINQDSGYLMIDIANAFVTKGFDVHLITGRFVERNNLLNEKIKVTKIIRYQRDSTLKRLGTWLIGFVQILFLIIFRHRKKKLLLVSNPPFATLIPLLTNNPFSLLIYDVYPDALVEYKILNSDSYIIKSWKKANKRVFKKARHLYTLNEAMKSVLGKYTNLEKVKVIPIWTDNTFLKPILKNKNTFIKENDLEDKFIIQYSGNLGKTHNIEKLLDVAEILKEEPFFFLIIGGGEKFILMESEIERRKLKNTRLLPWQPTKTLPESLAAADIGVVTLGVEASGLSIPSKVYNLMSVGVPILSIADKSSALAALVEDNKIGENFEIKDVANMANFILKIQKSKSKREKYAQNSLYLSKEYTPENAFNFIV